MSRGGVKNVYRCFFFFWRLCVSFRFQLQYFTSWWQNICFKKQKKKKGGVAVMFMQQVCCVPICRRNIELPNFHGNCVGAGEPPPPPSLLVAPGNGLPPCLLLSPPVSPAPGLQSY